MSRNRTAALIIGFALLFCFLGRGLKLTNEPTFCAKCHIIEPFYHSWQDSLHARQDVECVDCHFRPGVTGLIQGKLYAALKLTQFTIGAYHRPVAAESVTNQNCLCCHENILTREIALAGGLSFAHEAHITEQQAECRGCHPAIGHPGAVYQPVVTQPPRISRDICLLCHDGRAASGAYKT